MSLDGSAAMAWHVASVSRGGGEQRNAGEMGFRFLKYLQRKNEHGWACRILFWLFWFRQIRLGLLALAGFNTFQNMFGWCARMWFNDVAPSSPKKNKHSSFSHTSQIPWFRISRWLWNKSKPMISQVFLFDKFKSNHWNLWKFPLKYIKMGFSRDLSHEPINISPLLTTFNLSTSTWHVLWSHRFFTQRRSSRSCPGVARWNASSAMAWPWRYYEAIMAETPQTWFERTICWVIIIYI
jgi:hypothetical protein